MLCENYLCIYWSKNYCTLKNISLDIQGNCLDCIYINIKKDLLEKLRNDTLKKLDDYDNH